MHFFFENIYLYILNKRLKEVLSFIKHFGCPCSVLQSSNENSFQKPLSINRRKRNVPLPALSSHKKKKISWANLPLYYENDTKDVYPLASNDIVETMVKEAFSTYFITELYLSLINRYNLGQVRTNVGRTVHANKLIQSPFTVILLQSHDNHHCK